MFFIVNHENFLGHNLNLYCQIGLNGAVIITRRRAHRKKIASIRPQLNQTEKSSFKFGDQELRGSRIPGNTSLCAIDLPAPFRPASAALTAANPEKFLPNPEPKPR